MSMIIHLLGCKSSDEFPPDVFALKEEEIYIGRLPSCKITMNDDSISRLHARIYKEGGEWWIEDIRSRNGIFINGRSVSSAKLIEGDIITTGDVHFTLNNRRVDQIEHIKEWVLERIQDAAGYRADIVSRKDFDISQSHSGLIPSMPEPTAYAEQFQAPQVQPAPQAQPAPQQPAAYQPAPQVTPTPVQQPQYTPTTPSSSSSNRRPIAQNVMGNDTTIIVIIVVSLIVLVAGLLWKFRDLIMPSSSF